MKDTDLLQMALGLSAPWQVSKVEFDSSKSQLTLMIDFPKGSRFVCPVCGQGDCKAYDTEQKTWRHLNFFQHETFISARVPRTDCPRCGPRLISVPWARSGSGFTLLFEALVMILGQQMPINSLAQLIGEHDTRLWRVLHYYVHCARDEVDLSTVVRVGVDETSKSRGHDYVSLFVDLDERRVIFATPGKDASTLERFSQDLSVHHGDPQAVQEVCCDMSPAFIKGVEQQLPNAQFTFDKFHVMKIINEAVDEVRRQEQKLRPELKYSRYVWLKNPQNLKASQSRQLEELDVKRLNLKTARAYHIRLNFQELWQQCPEQAGAFLKKWYFWATHSRLEPIIKAAHTIKRHWQGILRWFTSQITNGVLEGINSLVQAAKARARGYRSARNFITMIYLLAGKLKFDLPT
jgi:transposase